MIPYTFRLLNLGSYRLVEQISLPSLKDFEKPYLIIMSKKTLRTPGGRSNIMQSGNTVLELIDRITTLYSSTARMN